MTERLTRSQRRKIESQTHTKVDLDHLAEIDVKQLAAQNEANQSEQGDLSSDGELSDEQLSDEEASDDEEEDSDSFSPDSSDDEDLDQLLDKAQQALSAQTDTIQLDEKADDKAINTKLSKMNIGLSVDKELYLKTTNGRTKIVPDAVALVDSDHKAPKKASVVLKESKDQEKFLTKKERLAEREKTTGKAWFDMPKTEITDEIKRDLQVLKMRHILDRKRHYKKMGKRSDPKYFQIGTIIESPTEFFSARLTKKERKQNIVDELMASDELKQYYKRKYNEVQDKSTSGGKKHFKKLKALRKGAK
ncbi:rRNA-processing protein fcf2 [Choanephora cucurbitarum]|uniref:rRNA-processing protein fcf2 n=1 Tax=Choanephora cucurbitarum TaxID=101091 RepID=A0A1C7NRC3_9FUNG|nr:rRNA-processing protein fcf2 [Choanephora cucurbitarum]